MLNDSGGLARFFPVGAENSIALDENSNPIKRHRSKKSCFSPSIIRPLIASDLIELPSEIA